MSNSTVHGGAGGAGREGGGGEGGEGGCEGGSGGGGGGDSEGGGGDGEGGGDGGGGGLDDDGGKGLLIWLAATGVHRLSRRRRRLCVMLFALIDLARKRDCKASE